MKHLNEEQLISFIYNDFENGQEEIIKDHLNICTDCSQKCKELKSQLLIIDTSDDDISDDNIFESIQKAIANEETVKNSSNEEILSPEELADFLKISIDAIYELLHDIPYLNLAGRIRFKRSSVETWLENREFNNPKRSGQKCIRELSVKLWRDVI